MASTRDIRRRIKSIKSTQQITKAMKMVSAAKLRRAQSSVIAARPYSDELGEVLARLRKGNANHPFLQAREVKKVCYVVFAGERGLCGGFNSNIFRRAETEVEKAGHPHAVVAVGRKTRDYFRRRRHEIVMEFTNVGDNPSFSQAKELAQRLSALYVDGTFDEIHLIYSEFKSALTQTPVRKQLLPVPAHVEDPDEPADSTEYIFEPDETALVKALLPRYVDVTVYRSMLEAKASEHGARMTAMSAATDNALEIIDRLTLSLNRARQAAITKEISEIVGGAAALS